MNYYLQAFRQYADFSGKASRKEFWMFFLFNSITIFVLYLIIGFANLRTYNPDAITSDGVSPLPVLLLLLYVLATFIPNLAITVRRLHDAGESGKMILISLIPFVGIIWLLVLLCRDSVAGTSEYGASYSENEIYTGKETSVLYPHCNSPIDADAVFCENCGNKIK